MSKKGKYRSEYDDFYLEEHNDKKKERRKDKPTHDMSSMTKLPATPHNEATSQRKVVNPFTD